MSLQDRDALDQAMGMVRHAPKIGKIAQAAAAGGLPGAAAQAATQYHKELAAAAAVVLALPVLFLLLLPSVIFNGLTDSAHALSVLNNNLQIAENVIEIRDGVAGILQSAYEDTLAEIAAAREGQPYTDLADPMGGQVSFNAFSILSMYCAHMGETDYTRLSIEQLVRQVEAHKAQYFTYTAETEARTVMVEQTVDDVTVLVPEEHDFTVYTVVYAGEELFAELWELTEAEQAVAREYAQNLTLFLYEVEEQAGISLLEQITGLAGDAPSPTGGGFGNPFSDPTWRSHITSGFGRRADVGLPGRDTTNHNGIDIAYGYGTPILAVQSGTVILAGSHASYGNYVVIDHGGGICTLYAHCSRLLVSAGQTVSKYDTIAQVGSTGDSTGNHLHISVIVDGTYVDPSPYLN